ncbi:hypothetical protein PR048_007168 [Dryococelus australis]|uniref:Uncharacterized protein n=1 Tax=Dryococelus australis TaxID=614101 RepID=A0ABQ9ICW3_9NEOP|nr:hypothetical protein PR048_007168 [Dryococelus australis]
MKNREDPSKAVAILTIEPGLVQTLEAVVVLHIRSCSRSNEHFWKPCLWSNFQKHAVSLTRRHITASRKAKGIIARHIGLGWDKRVFLNSPFHTTSANLLDFAYGEHVVGLTVVDVTLRTRRQRTGVIGYRCQLVAGALLIDWPQAKKFYVWYSHLYTTDLHYLMGRYTTGYVRGTWLHTTRGKGKGKQDANPTCGGHVAHLGCNLMEEVGRSGCKAVSTFGGSLWTCEDVGISCGTVAVRGEGEGPGELGAANDLPCNLLPLVYATKLFPVHAQELSVVDLNRRPAPTSLYHGTHLCHVYSDKLLISIPKLPSSTGSLRFTRVGNETRRALPLADGFSRGTPVAPTLVFLRCSISFQPRRRRQRPRNSTDVTGYSDLERIALLQQCCRHTTGVTGGAVVGWKAIALDSTRSVSAIDVVYDSMCRSDRGESIKQRTEESRKRPSVSAVSQGTTFVLSNRRIATAYRKYRKHLFEFPLSVALMLVCIFCLRFQFDCCPTLIRAPKNPPTNVIVRHDSHMRNSGGDPVGNGTRSAVVRGGSWTPSLHEREDGIEFRCVLQDMISLLAAHQGEPNSIPGWVTREFSHVGIMPDDGAGQRDFSGFSRFPRPFFPALLRTRLNHAHRLSRPR